MSDSLRLFIASPLGGPAAASLNAFVQDLRTQLESQPQSPALRWAPAEQWHLTWRFLGQTAKEQVPRLEAGLCHAMASQPGISTHWKTLSWWPSPNRPQILVAQLHSTSQLQAIYSSILYGLKDSEPLASSVKAGGGKLSNGECNKPFNPHITLARVKTRGQSARIALPRLPALPVLPAWDIDAVTLFSSNLNSSGALHIPIYTVKLTVSPVD